MFSLRALLRSERAGRCSDEVAVAVSGARRTGRPGKKWLGRCAAAHSQVRKADMVALPGGAGPPLERPGLQPSGWQRVPVLRWQVRKRHQLPLGSPPRARGRVALRTKRSAPAHGRHLRLRPEGLVVLPRRTRPRMASRRQQADPWRRLPFLLGPPGIHHEFACRGGPRHRQAMAPLQERCSPTESSASRLQPGGLVEMPPRRGPRVGVQGGRQGPEQHRVPLLRWAQSVGQHVTRRDSASRRPGMASFAQWGIDTSGCHGKVRTRRLVAVQEEPEAHLAEQRRQSHQTEASMSILCRTTGDARSISRSPAPQRGEAVGRGAEWRSISVRCGPVRPSRGLVEVSARGRPSLVCSCLRPDTARRLGMSLLYEASRIGGDLPGSPFSGCGARLASHGKSRSDTEDHRRAIVQAGMVAMPVSARMAGSRQRSNQAQWHGLPCLRPGPPNTDGDDVQEKTGHARAGVRRCAPRSGEESAMILLEAQTGTFCAWSIQRKMRSWSEG